MKVMSLELGPHRVFTRLLTLDVLSGHNIFLDHKQHRAVGNIQDCICQEVVPQEVDSLAALMELPDTPPRLARISWWRRLLGTTPYFLIRPPSSPFPYPIDSDQLSYTEAQDFSWQAAQIGIQARAGPSTTRQDIHGKTTERMAIATMAIVIVSVVLFIALVLPSVLKQYGGGG